MSSEVNPFTQVYEALWEMLENHQGFVDLVPEKNRIKMLSHSPVKDQVSTADLPEVRILPFGGRNHMNNSTNSTKLTRRYNIQIATGTHDVSEALYLVEFEIIRALHDWTKILKELQWSGCTFVKVFRELDIQEGASVYDLNRGIKGWSSVWSCEIELWFNNNDMEPIPVGTG